MTRTLHPTGQLGPFREVYVGSLSLQRFEGVVVPAEFERLRAGMEQGRTLLDGRAVWNVNSTARGGGVAEMLVSLLAYARGATVDARWLVISGDERFFAITKRIHNRLHGYPGDGGPLGEAEREHYERTLAPYARELRGRVRPGDAVILHDPQTAGLIPHVRALGVPVLWRCHIGVDEPNELAIETRRFLDRYVGEADASVFSREAFAWEEVDPSRRAIIAPSIDAFAPKNEALDEPTASSILARSGLRARHTSRVPARFTRMDGSQDDVRRQAYLIEGSPLRHEEDYVLQVSRWDALKDPLGVIAGFAEHIAPDSDAHLIYAGPAVGAVSDDPESAAVLVAAQSARAALSPALRGRVHLALLPMDDLEENAAIVNALQRGARHVVQKSLAEGFGLTVAEAMWKSRAVTASRIGGMQDQIENGRSGVLLDDPRDLTAFGAAVSGLWRDRDRSRAMGEAARQRVRERFLGPHSLLAYLELLARLLHEEQPAPLQPGRA